MADAMGPVERAVAALVAELVESGELGPHGAVLAVSVAELARTLDNGAGLATAGVHKELRATLAELSPRGGDDDDDLFSRLERELSSPLGDDPQP